MPDRNNNLQLFSLSQHSACGSCSSGTSIRLLLSRQVCKEKHIKTISILTRQTCACCFLVSEKLKGKQTLIISRSKPRQSLLFLLPTARQMITKTTCCSISQVHSRHWPTVVGKRANTKKERKRRREKKKIQKITKE